MSCRRVIAALFVTLALSAPVQADTAYYLVETLAEQSPQGASRAQARELGRIYADLSRVSGVEATLVYSDDPDINAFATENGDQRLVVVQEGLLQKLGNDRDAVAATLGHELAHHKADHIRAGRRKQEGVRVFGAILGAVVGAKVGRNSGELAGAVSGAAVGVGANLLALKFSRNQELEADRLSIGWMIEAGYSPNGMLRLQQQLGAMPQGKRRAAMLSTHPPSAKRYQSAEKLIAKLAPPPELLARAATPLVDAERLAAAETEIRSAEQQRIAAALKPPGDAPSAAALAPIDGISFESYAALSNELLHAGDARKAQVLKKHRLDDARLTRLSEGYVARMREHPPLAQRYNVGFFRATQGRLAPWGRDLADSYEKGQAPQLDPPYPMETARSLLAAMHSRVAQNQDPAQRAALEAEILKPHGLTYYDFVIGHNWWSRKVNVAALGGDTALLQQYYSALQSARAAPEESGVRVGENVKVGNNVRIGTHRPAQDDADAARSKD